MNNEVAFTDHSNEQARSHLLCMYDHGRAQEHLCFGLWYPSQGQERFTAIVNEILLPRPNEVRLHGNASFEGKYLTRAIREAKHKHAGLAIMHSHPGTGWQDLSHADILAERDIVAYQVQGTKRPLVGLTIGSDGYWSARFWSRIGDQMVLQWCDKVRVPRRPRYQIDRKPSFDPRKNQRPMLQRTVETWGVGFQKGIEELRIGIVGLGSVGAIVAEAMARIGVSRLTLIDPDRLELHNLDRFIYGRSDRIGELKVELVKRECLKNATSKNVDIRALPHGIECVESYRHALDCDLLLSCVDRPVPRDVLNHVAISNVIPVIDAGIAVDVDPKNQLFESARWRAHIVIPGNACLRCTGQYTSSDVVAELDGSLDDPSYIQNLPENQRPRHQNVFPFSLGCASMQTNLMIRYLIGESWWPNIQRQEYRFITGRTTPTKSECGEHCSFRGRCGLGHSQIPHYLTPVSGSCLEDSCYDR